jgi:hypothetical protein
LKYALPGISTFITIALWLSERWLEEEYSSRLENLPLGWLVVLTLALLLGVLYADIFNPNSPLRRAIAVRRKIADVQHFVLASKGNESSSWYEAVLHLSFSRVMANVDCTVQVTQYVGLPHAESSFVVLQQNFPRTEENLVRQLVVARFPKRIRNDTPVGYPSWGDQDAHTWAGDGNHIVTLKLSSGIRSQTERFVVTAIKNVGGDPEPVLLFGGPETQAFIQVHT